MANIWNRTLLVFLLILLSTVAVVAQTGSSGIEVKLSEKQPLHLKITIRSLAKARTTINKDFLPWEFRESIILTAVTPSGTALPRKGFYGDLGLIRLSLNPNQLVSGEINLEDEFPDLNEYLKRNDVLLFWAYHSPKELNHPSRWSGGFIQLPRPKIEAGQ